MYYIVVTFKDNLKQDIDYIKSISKNYVCSTYFVSKNITSLVFLFKDQSDLDNSKKLFEYLPEKFNLSCS